MRKHIQEPSLWHLLAKIICEVITMWVIKQCTCGSTEFEIDDDTTRCAECGRLARFTRIKESEDKDD